METLPQNKPIPPLIYCIIMDLLGCVSFSIPVVGEFSDVIWAPLSAYLFMRSFGGKFGKVGAVLNFIEEALPFTDIIPSFSIAWFIKKYL
jgi:hypothetical protein